MMRWGCLALGVVSVVFGLVGYLMHPPMSTESRTVSVEEALALLGENDRIAVSIDAGMDLEHKLYSTLCERPNLTRRPTDQTYTIDPTDTAELTRSLGNRVRLTGDLDPVTIAVQVLYPQTVADEELRGERILAPVHGTGGRVWVISPFFQAADPRRDTWLGTVQLEGVLGRLVDIHENLSTFTIDYEFDEIQELASAELGLTIAPETFLLDTANDTESSGVYRMPVAGSGGAIWAMPFNTNKGLPSWVNSGPVSGLMWVWDSDKDFAHDLAEASGFDLPPRYAVVHHDETPAEHNTKTTFGLKLFTGLGAGMILISLILFGIRKLRSP